MEQFLEEIDLILELLSQAHWTDFLMIGLGYAIILAGLMSQWKQKRCPPFYNYVWLVIFPPVGIYLIQRNRKIKRKDKKRITYAVMTGWFILISSVFIYVGWVPKPEYQPTIYDSDIALQKRPAGQKLEVHFIDIGQGDATLIVYDDFHILIDGGNNGSETILLDYLQQVGVDDLEMVIATHPDADHIGGLPEVLEKYRVHLIIDSGEPHTSQTYKAYLKQVQAQQAAGAQYLEDDDLMFYLADDITLEIIETGDDNGDRNNNSVVAKLSYGDIDFLFTGDMESSTEQKILARDLEAEILKAGHHGSKTSSSLAFLQEVQPEVVVISAGKNNSYGHPHQTLLDRLYRYTDEIYVTYEMGTIIVSTDGEGYEISLK